MNSLTQKNYTYYIKIIIPLVFIFALFVFSAYLAQKYKENLISIIGDNNSLGVILYVAITIISVIIPPFSSAPLIPVAANIWGFFWAGVFSIIGWVVGSMTVFLIARIYGVPIVSKIISLDKIHGIQKLVLPRHLFWSVVLLRMVLPVDILSYAIGLLSVIGWQNYLIATFIGVSPFAFVFAYTGILPFHYQLIAFFIVVPLAVLWILRIRKRFNL